MLRLKGHRGKNNLIELSYQVLLYFITKERRTLIEYLLSNVQQYGNWDWWRNLRKKQLITCMWKGYCPILWNFLL